jgi:diacylglycerol kinase (ATP)
MALNKPKYTLWNNARYAINGLIEVIKNESSFKLQLLVFFLMSAAAWLLPISTGYKMILNISLFIPIMAELANSSIERVVDLVTLEYHELAKRAKDAGAALVFISLIATGAVWLSVLLLAFELV